MKQSLSVETFDAAVVLGAMVRPDGRPSPALARRVAHAVGLAQRGVVRSLLMSGGPMAHPTPEAWAMRDLAIATGIAPDRIAVEDRSRNTIDNARLSAQVAEENGWRRLVVVTDLYHLPRALYVFRRFGVAAAGSGARPQRPAAEWWAACAREALALPWTVLRVEREKLF
jgi:uncharacterized SAM-binding protein YcdF (DUF218 family)